jgi:D-3-phosphoglycerate dehydrogenase
VRRLSGRTLGLVGYGAIGRAVAARARAFGMEVAAHDPLVEEAGVPLLGLGELLERSDVLSLHVPLTAATAGLIGRAELRRLPPGAVLVNASRGGVVDAEALVEALREGRLAGAGIDVLPEEPAAPDHPLLQMENVVVTPHMGYYSEEALDELRRTAVENLIAALTSG